MKTEKEIYEELKADFEKADENGATADTGMGFMANILFRLQNIERKVFGKVQG